MITFYKNTLRLTLNLLLFVFIFCSPIFSQQKSNSKVIDVEGGAQTTEFDIYADQYETNKHFFLSHYFKSRYNEAMSQLPFINSPVNITKIEVWVTNKTGTVEDTRNILAFMDLGESQADMYNTILFSDNAETAAVIRFI